MNKCFKFSSVVSLVLAALLQACGGGGASGAGSSKNPSAPNASVMTNGVVTGFGSVVVDENEI